MRGKLYLLVFVVVMLGLLATQSCSKEVFACFTTDVNQDSLQRNRVVTFNANCSSNASEFYWEFNNNPDSTYFSSVVTKTLKDTGSLSVYLLVVNGNHSASTTQTLYVRP